MNRKLNFIAAILIILSMVLAALCFWGLTPFLSPMINTNGTELTGVPVTVSKITANPLKGKLIIQGLKISNPNNFTGATIAEFDEIEIFPDFSTLADDTVIIKKLFINSPRFSYERNDTTSNIEQFGSNIREQEKIPVTKKVIIQHLLISDGQVTGKLTGMLLTVPIKSINLVDMGMQDGGVSYGRFVSDLSATILENVVTAIEDASGKPIIPQSEVSTNKTEATSTAL